MKGTEFDRYDALIHAIYDAALQPSRWPHVLADVVRAQESSKGLLYTPNHAPAQGGFLFPHEIPESAIALWSAKFVDNDPLIAAATERGIIAKGEGIAIDGEELVPVSDLIKTDFYRELWEPINIGRVCSGIVFDGTDARKVPTVLAVYRSLREPSFERHQLELLERLLAHISRSLGVMFHLRDSELQTASSLAALERLAAGIFLLSDDLDVQFANSSGLKLVERDDPLQIVRAQGRPGQLSLPPRLQSMQSDFDRLLAEAAAPLHANRAAHFSQALVLPNENGSPSCVLHIAPLGGAAVLSAGSKAPRAIVIAYEVGLATSIQPERLTELFDLTPAEARAAVQVLAGGTIAEMASRLGVTVNTFKTQIKAVYAKTGTNRQSDFLKLLLALARPS